ncbi:acireductone synthase [Pseudoalteromonas sp. OOF1S-7]|uniref:acireductone synthase n=1 Tax=Pseudoalteromonas sp. OOF1S-7 TaxID=2917757 RepID=UPI001EF6AC5B|nr:acireductone synthase [Pseudoalteromonas sp. OOF1S-7]MCG7536030.1 acireductone synthase [Pseudoalteromonas sp. OOF1S-7]
MIKAILTDIEGTITRISFVKEILFPYAADKLPDFVIQHARTPEVSAQLDAVRAELGEPQATLERVIGSLLNWIAEDKKITPLKQLQGMIWQYGYQNGDFTGHIYPDAHQFLCTEHAAGKALYVYSSGSVQAQQLLFAHSDYGDIRPMFSGYFDTRVGAKQQPEAYQTILSQISFAPHEVLFLSDVVAELDAAQAAGMQTLQLWRDGQTRAQAHPFIENFSQYKAKESQ